MKYLHTFGRTNAKRVSITICKRLGTKRHDINDIIFHTKALEKDQAFASNFIFSNSKWWQTPDIFRVFPFELYFEYHALYTINIE